MNNKFPDLKQLEVILKTVERCNLNCSYCYFFNGADQSFKKHPPFIKKETLLTVCKFLKDACNDFSLKKLVIDIHGGEPTLQKKEDFDKMCSLFEEAFSENIKLKLKIQTNGTLITPEWINLFSRHKIYVGVSLDGTREENDIYRVDHQGKGSYSATKKGLELLRKAYEEQRIPSLGILSVINPKYDAKKIYRHFVQDLGIKHMDFLLPDHTHDTFVSQSSSADEYGKFLCDLFEAWTGQDNPEITVRILESNMRTFLGGDHIMMGLNHNVSKAIAITIASNGDLSGDDALRSSVPNHMFLANIKNTSLRKFLDINKISSLRESIAKLPVNCSDCRWSKICGGGLANNRYSKQNYFNNPSIYCSGLKTWFSKIEDYLIKHGIPQDILKKNLVIK